MLTANRPVLKWIRCRVPDGARRAFSAAQKSWSALRGTPGFTGQIGGWSAADPSQACILGLWRDRESYESFMGGEHDRIFERSGQRSTYESSSVVIADELVAMPGAERFLKRAVHRAAFLRVADCLVKPRHADAFVDVQRLVWVPGMRAARGMLGGSFGAVAGSPLRFLVTTLWTDEAAHAQYARRYLPRLRREASVEKDTEQISGTLVNLEAAWTVG